METKKITKTDGKRMFVEISRKEIEPQDLPPLKKGDKVLIIPRRSFTDKFLDKQIGKEISFFVLADMTYGKPFYYYVRGILQPDKEEYWAKHDPMKRYSDDFDEYMKKVGAKPPNGKSYAILEYSDAYPDGKPLQRVSSESLSSFYDVRFRRKEPFVRLELPECSNMKCHYKIPSSFRFCPECGKKNVNYQGRKWTKN